MRTPNKQQPKKIPPRPSHQVPSSNPSSSPSFFSTMTQGAALGMGSSVGHRMVDGLFFEPKQNKKLCPYTQNDSVLRTTSFSRHESFPPTSSSGNIPKNKEPTITFDDPYLCNKKMEQYVKCTHEQSNHSICDKLYDNYLQCVSSHLERE